MKAKEKYTKKWLKNERNQRIQIFVFSGFIVLFCCSLAFMRGMG